MPARDVLNADQTGPMQLPMFMRARDLVDSLTGTLDRSQHSVEEVMDQKLYQSQQHIGPHGGGVYKSVEREGVLNPVQMVHGMSNSLLMGQGHHRTAAAEDIERKRGRDVWVPVVHTDAREHSPTPVDIYSNVNEKRAAIQDYHNWRTTTPALGLDVGWLQAREDAE